MRTIAASDPSSTCVPSCQPKLSRRIAWYRLCADKHSSNSRYGVHGERCACSRQGCLETILAVPHLRRLLDAAGADHDEVLTRVGEQLGAALAPVVGTLNLHELVLSGPQELLDGPLREAADRSIRARTMPVSSEGLVVRTSILGEDVVLVGAAVLVLSGQLGVS